MDRFDPAARFGVWSAHEGRCFWCGELVAFKDMQLDHVLPRTLSRNPEKLRRAVEQYGLSAEFEIESYDNWVPSCARCNGRKANHLLKSSPAMVHAMSMVEMRARMARDNAERIRADSRKAKVAAVLSQTIEDGELTIDDIKALLEDLRSMSYRAAKKRIEWIRISEKFKYKTDGIVGIVASSGEESILRYWSLRPSNVGGEESEVFLMQMTSFLYPSNLS